MGKKSLREAVEFLIAKPGYLKKGNEYLALYLETSKKNVSKAKKLTKKHILSLEEDNILVKSENKAFKRLFFDIETSYNKVASFRIGETRIDYTAILEEKAVICICYKWEDDPQIHSLEWNKGDDKQMLIDFMKILESADQIVGHNSDNFDIKWLRGRCLYHRIPMFPDFNTVDTLKLSRTMNLNSRRLDYLGRYLKLGHKLETGGLDLWIDIVERNNPDSMNLMVRYCKQDVNLLQKVYTELQPYCKPKTHIGVHIGNGKHTCPNCGSDHSRSKGRVISALGTIKHRRACSDCGQNYYISDSLYKKL